MTNVILAKSLFVIMAGAGAWSFWRFRRRRDLAHLERALLVAVAILAGLLALSELAYLVAMLTGGASW